MRLKTPKKASRWPQEGPKSPQESPKRPQESPKTPQDAPKGSPGGPQTGPGRAQDGPKTAPRRPQVGSKSLPRSIPKPSYVTTSPQRRPRGLKRPQEGSKRPPRGPQQPPKRLPRGLKHHFEATLSSLPATCSLDRRLHDTGGGGHSPPGVLDNYMLIIADLRPSFSYLHVSYLHGGGCAEWWGLGGLLLFRVT